jgi:hypothetical protein
MKYAEPGITGILVKNGLCDKRAPKQNQKNAHRSVPSNYDEL